MILLCRILAIESNCWGIKKRVIKLQESARNKTLVFFYIFVLCYYNTSTLSHIQIYTIALETNRERRRKKNRNMAQSEIIRHYYECIETSNWHTHSVDDEELIKVGKWRCVCWKKTPKYSKAENWFGRLALFYTIICCLFVIYIFFYHFFEYFYSLNGSVCVRVCARDRAKELVCQIKENIKYQNVNRLESIVSNLDNVISFFFSSLIHIQI